MIAKIFFQAAFCTIIASLTALITHVYVMKWVQPYVNAIIDQNIKEGIDVPPVDPLAYSWIVIIAAYLTAIAMVAVCVFAYYHAQHLIPGKKRFVKMLIVMAILFGVKGDLVREPLMDFIMSYESMDFFTSLKLVILNHIDKWMANTFMVFCVVYFCPKNGKSNNK